MGMREKAFLIWNIHTLILLLKRISISIFFYISKFEINLKTSKNYDFVKIEVGLASYIYTYI